MSLSEEEMRMVTRLSLLFFHTSLQEVVLPLNMLEAIFIGNFSPSSQAWLGRHLHAIVALHEQKSSLWRSHFLFFT